MYVSLVLRQEKINEKNVETNVFCGQQLFTRKIAVNIYIYIYIYIYLST